MIINFVTALFSLFTVGHIIHRADVWEARLASNVGHVLDNFLDMKGREKRWVRWLVFVASVCYFLFSIVARIVCAAILLTVYYVMRIVLPIVYLWSIVSFGATATIRIFEYLLRFFGVEKLALINITWQQVLATVPAILIAAIFVTAYVSIVSVIAVKYHQTFFSNTVN